MTGKTSNNKMKIAKLRAADDRPYMMNELLQNIPEGVRGRPESPRKSLRHYCRYFLLTKNKIFDILISMKKGEIDLKRKYIFLLIFILSLSGCASGKYTEKNIFAMDTVMNLKAYGKNTEVALTAAEAKINELDKKFRRGSVDSEIYRLNSGDDFTPSDDTLNIVKQSVEISEYTDGAFDITVAPIMDLWGFYTKNFRVPENTEIADALKKTGFENITVNNSKINLKNGAAIDLGGIAKGYTADAVTKILKDNNIESAIISLGGNIAAIGTRPDKKPWKVAIQNPDNSGTIGYVSVSDKAVVTSGGYQRYFERDGKIYHHIIDSSTGFPADNTLKSVTVICDSGTTADALSTALFVMGYEKAADFYKTHGNFDMILITDDNKIHISSGIQNNFTGGEYEIIG